MLERLKQENGQPETNKQKPDRPLNVFTIQKSKSELLNTIAFVDS